MINKIIINNLASYKNNVEIDKLEKINFFFGNNGSGKTTISRVIYNNNTEPIDSYVEKNSICWSK